MNNDIYSKIKNITIEDLILVFIIVYIIIEIAIKKEGKNYSNNEKYIIITSIFVLILGYLLYENYKELKSSELNSEQYNNAKTNLIFFSFLAIVLIIILYYLVEPRKK